MVERALRNRARFAIEQYRWASVHFDSIPLDIKDRLCAAVKLKVRYSMILLMAPKATSIHLFRLNQILEKLAKDDLSGNQKLQNIVSA